MTTSDGVRAPEQTARKRALTVVFDALEEIEVLATRLRRYRDDVRGLQDCSDLATVLGTAADGLEGTRKELQQGAYFTNGQARLF